MRYAGRPKKSFLSFSRVCDASARDSKVSLAVEEEGADGDTLKVSPAPSQSLEVRIGVWIYVKSSF